MKDLSKKQTSIEYIETVLKYLVNAAPADNISYEEIKAAVDEALPNIGCEIMPTVADSLREQGMQQGMQQGILQNAREAVIVDLEVRFETVPPPACHRLPAHVLHVLCSLAMAGRCHCETRPSYKNTCFTCESVARR